MSELFSFLKQHTLSSHQALEAHYPFSHMMQTSTFHEREYALILQVLGAFHQYTQQWLVTLPPAQCEMLHTQHVNDAILKDLQRLPGQQELTPQAFSIGAVAAPAHARALAAGYVWMGSSLGGKMIERWLRKEFPDLPRAYYTQMKEVSQHWPAFIGSVKAGQAYSAAQMAHIADAANALFTGLRDTATNLRQAGSATES